MFFKWLEKFEDLFLIVTIAAMQLVLTAQVFARYVFNSPLVWSEELARYLFVWVAFVGASYGVRKRLHIHMESLFNVFPKKAKIIVAVALNLIAAAAFLYVVPYGVDYTLNQVSIESSAMQISMAFVFAALPIGFTLTALRLVVRSVAILREKEAP